MIRVTPINQLFSCDYSYENFKYNYYKLKYQNKVLIVYYFNIYCQKNTIQKLNHFQFE